MTSVNSNFNFMCGRPHRAGSPPPVHMRLPEPDPLAPLRVDVINGWPLTVTDALLLLVFGDICSSSLSLSFESLDSILISNFHYYFQDGRPMRYYNHRYYKPYNIYDYNRRTWQDHRHHIHRRKAI